MNTLKEIFLQGFNGLTKNDLIFIFFQLFSILFIAFALKVFFFFTSGRNKEIFQHPLALYAVMACALTCTVKFNAALALLAIPAFFYLLKTIQGKILQIQMMQLIGMVAAILVGSGSIVLALIFTSALALLLLVEKIK